ncbi:acetylornithine transaminase [Paenibacillus turpanensis]|uniref:acetylornithine transaminase n=1 Tax=Paenibacillus turpanensis TaxID=2689078 RepID=UPI00140755C8|nr:acetylornithine transaminase [Paenibacillus turpanensis]
MAQTQSNLFPSYGRFPITLVKGEGSRLWDDQGKEYIDLMCGLAVTNLGHAPEAVKEKLKLQLDELWHVSNLYHIPGQEKLASLLTANSCTDRVFFCNSGAEANEAAIKLARKYHQKVLGTGRYEIITFQQSFHGRTLATLTATGQDKVKEGFTPLPDGFVHVSFNDIEAVKHAVNDRTAAIMLEFLQAEGGVHAADPDFVSGIVELCKDHGILLIADEIQTGMGRTGKLFAYEHYGIEPDIITLAKGLGSGFPIGAMLGKEKLAEAFGPGSHGSTFGGTPLACSVGIATVETMVEQGIPARAQQMGELAVSLLQERLAGNPLVKDIRGKGLLIGIECVHAVADYIAEAQKRGVLPVSAGPNVIRLLPALTIPEADLKQGIDIVCGILTEAASQSTANRS